MRYRHVSVPRLGGAEVLRLSSEELPAPAVGQVRVRVLAAGVSYGDILLRAGVIPGGPKRPFTPGYDLVGEVDQVGPGTRAPAVGQRVVALVRSGGYAEYAIVPANRLVELPEGVDPVEASALALNYFIAQQMLHRVARVRRGGTVLVHGASGGVGTAFLELAALAEVTVYGTCSGARADQVRRLGGHPIDRDTEDFLRVVRGLPGGAVDAVFDPVGGPHFLRSYQAVRRGGVMVGYGQNAALRGGKPDLLVGAQGFLGGIVLPKLLPDGRRTLFYNAWSLEKSQPAAYQQDLATVLELLQKGLVNPRVGRTMALDEAADAHRAMETAAVSGKIVLVPAPA
ncbi:medium chain dehydrogenase/reductase family protein [Streptomyces sp. BE20]|uniref:medium chain dehydrogenase/reductase family protein n=1 Tax=Streptomycetaceae TaxID=2062 RepID=UPI002E77D7B0|nr:medium chain dehydrogenase/reductase family protein [Streptomyces sp. BE20]MEE1826412.1 medium chain dehydrogenase/reductase family protein [Streptomyces sp. BE20]